LEEALSLLQAGGLGRAAVMAHPFLDLAALGIGGLVGGQAGKAREGGSVVC
jgi:hypothetical protein